MQCSLLQVSRYRCSFAQGRISAKQHVSNVCENQFSLPVQSLAIAGC